MKRLMLTVLAVAFYLLRMSAAARQHHNFGVTQAGNLKGEK